MALRGINRGCRGLASKPMYGCPRSRKVFYERLGRVIGCGHVSSLRCGGWAPRASMEMRGPGAYQSGELMSSKGFIAFPGPDLTDHLPLPFVDLLTRPTFPWLHSPIVDQSAAAAGTR